MNGIEFDENLNWKTRKYFLKLKNDSAFKPENLEFYNNVTGNKIETEEVHINEIE